MSRIKVKLPVDIRTLVEMPAPGARLHILKMEECWIEKHIQPEVEKNFLRAGEIVDFFIIEEGERILWHIRSGDECDGCDGDGVLVSNRGTSVECPDCDGDGFIDGDGEERDVVTDYDGRAELAMAA